MKRSVLEAGKNIKSFFFNIKKVLYRYFDFLFLVLTSYLIIFQDDLGFIFIVLLHVPGNREGEVLSSCLELWTGIWLGGSHQFVQK